MHTNDSRTVWIGVLCLGLVACSEGVASIDPLPAAPSDETISRGLIDRSQSLAGFLGFFQRGGEGPFRIMLSRDSGWIIPARDAFASSTWTCQASTVVDEPRHAAFVMRGCTIQGITGDFDFSVHARGESLQKTDWSVEVTNRLNVGIAQARVIFRVPRELLPSAPDSALFFGQDEYVLDPVSRLTAARRIVGESWMNYSFDDQTLSRGFFNSFQGAQPVLSMHRPGMGLVVHDLDSINGSTGTLLVGSNDGAVEFGYLFSLEGELRPGNGRAGRPIELTPKLRLQVLPGQRPIDSAWWEAAMVYREHVTSVGMLPPRRLAEAPHPARWSHDCLYTLIGAGSSVIGENQLSSSGTQVDVAAWSTFMSGFIKFHSATGQRNFCPLLWGWSAVSPYAPISGVSELLRAFERLEREHNVSIHPGIYVLPTFVGSKVIGTPIDAAVVRNIRGERFTWDLSPNSTVHTRLYAVDSKHPAFVNDLLAGVDAAIAMGVEWVYSDNPFTQNFVSPAWGGIDASQPQAVRDLLLAIERRLTANGGGIIAVERQHMGMHGSIGEGFGRAFPDSRFVPFGTAVAHDFLTTSAFGDAFGGHFELWNAEPILNGTNPGASTHFPRYALDLAALGATGLDGHFGAGMPFYALRGHPDPRLDSMAQISDLMRGGLSVRRTHDALRTGRMLPPQQVSGGTVLIPRRRNELRETGTHLEPAARYTSAMFESVERPGTVVLTVANAESSRAIVEVTIDPASDRALQRRFALVGALQPSFGGRGVEVVRLVVPARSIATVTFTPVP
jgi:hypothetical protein